MAVFTVLRMCDHYFRPVPAVQFRHPVQHFLLAACFGIGILQLSALRVAVCERSEFRIMPDAHCPQAVQSLAAPGGIAVSQVGHLNAPAHFRPVYRNHAAGKQQLVIRMGYHHQQVRFIHRLLPLLNPVRHFSLAEGIDLIEAHDALLFHRGQDPDFLYTVQFEEDMVETGTSAFRDGCPAFSALFLDNVVVRHLLKT